MMRIILRRRVRPDPQSATVEYRQSALKVARLSIGRAAGQHVHIENVDVAPRHALLQWRGGRLQIRACGARRVNVNGRLCRVATLNVGDLMTFGTARLTVEALRADGVVVLRLNDPNALSVARVENRDDLSLRGAGLDPRPWAWFLVLGILSLGFLAPLGGALVSEVRPALRAAPAVPSDVLWQPGPLHAAHRAIGHDCNVCHTTPFERVQNTACEACHHTIHRHVSANVVDSRLFRGVLCADCHLEHDAQKTLVERSSTGCTACHAHLQGVAPDTALQDVADFSSQHPEFALTLLAAPANGSPERLVAVPGLLRAEARQESNLKFSHKVHLDPAGIDSPKGRHRLECAACHKTAAGGRYMLPIRMETHCAECHSLQFDEHDPDSKVPHGDVPAVMKALRDHFSRTFLDQNFRDHGPRSAERRRPGDEPARLSREQQLRAVAWADGQTRIAVGELFEKRVCVECHEVSRAARDAGTAEWRIAPVRLTQRWFPRAGFDHTVHATSACETCHLRVDQSEDAADVHMPRIATCRRCHGDDEPHKVATTCVTCHDFHRSGNGSFGVAADNGPPAASLSAELASDPAR